jgi:hypothetical protein
LGSVWWVPTFVYLRPSGPIGTLEYSQFPPVYYYQ